MLGKREVRQDWWRAAFSGRHRKWLPGTDILRGQTRFSYRGFRWTVRRHRGESPPLWERLRPFKLRLGKPQRYPRRVR